MPWGWRDEIADGGRAVLPYLPPPRRERARAATVTGNPPRMARRGLPARAAAVQGAGRGLALVGLDLAVIGRTLARGLDLALGCPRAAMPCGRPFTVYTCKDAPVGVGG